MPAEKAYDKPEDYIQKDLTAANSTIGVAAAAAVVGTAAEILLGFLSHTALATEMSHYYSLMD